MVKWLGFGTKDNTWVEESNLNSHCLDEKTKMALKDAWMEEYDTEDHPELEEQKKKNKNGRKNKKGRKKKEKKKGRKGKKGQVGKKRKRMDDSDSDDWDDSDSEGSGSDWHPNSDDEKSAV